MHAFLSLSLFLFLSAAACVLGEEIFVGGGMYKKEVVTMTEVYDPQTNMWENIDNCMQEARVGLGNVTRTTP